VLVEGTALRDPNGRQLLFRGYNAKVAGLFDVYFDDGRAPNYIMSPFAESDMTRMEQLGFSGMRLPVNWSALEPHPKEYNEHFLRGIGEILDMAARHHLLVFVDMHQDAYSKEIGEDGAPLWAIVPPPTMLLQGPSDDSRRLTPQVTAAGYSFFDDKPATDGRPLQAAFAAAVSQIVTRYASHPALLGVEAFNEPVVIVPGELDAFHAGLADAIHAIDPDLPMLFEPMGIRNQMDAAPIPDSPFAHGPGIYAPHIYTSWFSIPSQNGWASEDPSVLKPSMVAATQEAAGWGTPIFVTELGCDQSMDKGPKWLAAELDLQDELLVSSTIWEWTDPGTWGFKPAYGQERPSTVKVVSRPYPRAVAGDLLSTGLVAPGHLKVSYRATAKTQGLPHEVSASADYFQSFAVLCDGAMVDATRATGRVTFTCPDGGTGEHTFELVGTLAP
jgi:endoglycosylceramidase